eukprot:TRINITY_DN1801_c0_g1_i1.p1 TRINITY_DN1801_c0_g1~~TRINITY_DN1801_c0_g1_i1.p1  ORF type:complete len:237 (+),score=34.41 TRINITY_DN1801_c0_g1_i1:302-1012(+)
MAASAELATKCSISVTSLSYFEKYRNLTAKPSLISPPKLSLSFPRKLPNSVASNSVSNKKGKSPILLERPSYVPLEGEDKEDKGDEADQHNARFFSADDEEEEEDTTVHHVENRRWIDWEDEILGEIRPLLCLMRSILHSRWYASGERLQPVHEKIILERLLPYHPESAKKIGCGVDFISVDHHPDFGRSRCLFINRLDGEAIDFSYWKCLRGLVWKKYPLFAEIFIKKHLTFRKS